METSENIKNTVREKYSEIALLTKDTSSCCGESFNMMADDYKSVDGYHPEADLGLGCGLPTQFARIRKGDIVIDLGSGAGNDCFIARSETGEEGKVIGIDLTEAMISRARIHAEKSGYQNVEFRLGEIESLPVSSNLADVVVSNCVLNLVPDKRKAFAEIHRVLKPGGHFSISDIVLIGNLPDKMKEAAELYTGCITGAIQKEEYLGIIREAGFQYITLQKEKAITLPGEILDKYLSPDESSQFKESGTGIFSISIYAEKKNEACCDKETCCK